MQLKQAEHTKAGHPLLACSVQECCKTKIKNADRQYYCGRFHELLLHHGHGMPAQRTKWHLQTITHHAMHPKLWVSDAARHKQAGN
jgi:hypothetical protein